MWPSADESIRAALQPIVGGGCSDAAPTKLAFAIQITTANISGWQRLIINCKYIMSIQSRLSLPFGSTDRRVKEETQHESNGHYRRASNQSVPVAVYSCPECDCTCDDHSHQEGRQGGSLGNSSGDQSERIKSQQQANRGYGNS